jgi:hypothetical protein
VGVGEFVLFLIFFHCFFPRFQVYGSCIKLSTKPHQGTPRRDSLEYFVLLRVLRGKKCKFLCDQTLRTGERYEPLP